VNSDQKFTQPPPRYTEANLIRTLEELGIGRPSTYATIVSTIEARQYVERLASRFKPTLVGTVVSDLLTEHFPSIMDTGFTAEMEAKLDAIAEGDLNWVPMLSAFYSPFAERVETAMKDAPRVDRARLLEKSDEQCDGGEDMVVRTGRYGKFLSCSKFPECRVAYPLAPGENAKGDAIEAWKAQRTDQMVRCWRLHPEEAAKAAAEAEARGRRPRNGDADSKQNGRRPARRGRRTARRSA
jgi:DNA topoisomerase-1